MGRTGGFRYDVVYNLKPKEFLCRQLQCLGSKGGVTCILPEDGSTTLGRYDGTIGIFHDRKPVSHTYSKRATAAAFTYHHVYYRRLQPYHLVDVFRYGVCLSPFLCAYVRVCARCINERNDGELQSFCEFHLQEGLPIALGVGHTEVTQDSFPGIFAFLLTYEHHPVLTKPGKTRDYRLVVAKAPVPVKLHKIVKHQIDIVGGHGPEGMPCKFHDVVW